MGDFEMRSQREASERESRRRRTRAAEYEAAKVLAAAWQSLSQTAGISPEFEGHLEIFDRAAAAFAAAHQARKEAL